MLFHTVANQSNEIFVTECGVAKWESVKSRLVHFTDEDLNNFYKGDMSV